MRTTLAALALLASATTADAADWGCEFTDTRGNYLFYMFEQISPDTLAETGFMKNQVRTASPVGSRPPWLYQGFDSGGIVLTYLRDPRFKIASAGNSRTTRARAGNLLTQFHATLFRGNAVVASGACNFPFQGDGV